MFAFILLDINEEGLFWNFRTLRLPMRKTRSHTKDWEQKWHQNSQEKYGKREGNGAMPGLRMKPTLRKAEWKTKLGFAHIIWVARTSPIWRQFYLWTFQSKYPLWFKQVCYLSVVHNLVFSLTKVRSKEGWLVGWSGVQIEPDVCSKKVKGIKCLGKMIKMMVMASIDTKVPGLPPLKFPFSLPYLRAKVYIFHTII